MPGKGNHRHHLSLQAIEVNPMSAPIILPMLAVYGPLVIAAFVAYALLNRGEEPRRRR
jgi:hypothetical protein